MRFKKVKKTAEEIIELCGERACPDCGAALTPEDVLIEDWRGNQVFLWACDDCGYKVLQDSSGKQWGLLADKSWVDEHLEDIKAWQERRPLFCSRCGVRARMHTAYSNEEILLCEQCADTERLFRHTEEERAKAKADFWNWEEWAANPNK